MRRVEVWFNNGLFRAFPNVTKMDRNEEGNMLIIEFGGGHEAVINIDNANFMEIMNEQ